MLAWGHGGSPFLNVALRPVQTKTCRTGDSMAKTENIKKTFYSGRCSDHTVSLLMYFKEY